MQKNNERMKKFHNGSVTRKLVAGTLALFFAVLMGLVIFQVDLSTAWAMGGAFTRVDKFFQEHTIYLPDDLVVKHNVLVK